MSTVPEECKGCENECRIQFFGGSTTAAYYPPIYDKHGNNINPDGNVTSGNCFCSVCQKKWSYATQFGETTFQEVK